MKKRKAAIFLFVFVLISSLLLPAAPVYTQAPDAKALADRLDAIIKELEAVLAPAKVDELRAIARDLRGLSQPAAQATIAAPPADSPASGVLKPVQVGDVEYTITYISNKKEIKFVDGALLLQDPVGGWDALGITHLVVYKGKPETGAVVQDEATVRRVLMASAMEVYLARMQIDDLEPLPPGDVEQVDSFFRGGAYGVVNKIAFAWQDLAAVYQTDQGRYAEALRGMLAAGDLTAEEKEAQTQALAGFASGTKSVEETVKQLLDLAGAEGRAYRYNNDATLRAFGKELEKGLAQFNREAARVPGSYSASVGSGAGRIDIRGNGLLDLLGLYVTFQRMTAAMPEKVDLLERALQAARAHPGALDPALQEAMATVVAEGRSLPQAAIDSLLLFAQQTAVNKGLDIARDQLAREWAKFAWRHFGTRLAGHLAAGAVSWVMLGYAFNDIAFGLDSVHANTYKASYAAKASDQFGKLAHEIRLKHPAQTAVVDAAEVESYQAAYVFKKLAKIQFYQSFAEIIGSARAYKFVVDVFSGGALTRKQEDAVDYARITAKYLYPYWLDLPLIERAVRVAAASRSEPTRAGTGLAQGGAALGQTSTRPADDMVMVSVPAGEFTMGSTAEQVEQALQLCQKYMKGCQRQGFAAEQPAHVVALDAFWLDRTEVSNAQYGRCVAAGKCKESEYKNDSKFNGAAQPVVGVDWNDATAYCRWAGARLPTEAEWEYAARGPEGRVFPWGDDFDGTKLNYCDVNCADAWKDKAVDDGYGYTAPVGHYPAGASWAGVLDLAGNVWEWVADWYGDYPADRQSNSTGPASGQSRVLRGGTWLLLPYHVRSAYRDGGVPDGRVYYVGFRCASELRLAVPAAAMPSAQPTRTQTPPVVETVAAADLAQPLKTQVRAADEMVMVYAPAGEFMMGSNDGESNEKPVHAVALDAFWLDRTEVSNAQYGRCVAAGKCTESYYEDASNFNGAEQPVVGVDWNGAAAYCQWAGARLPTEAEWEYAARGPEGRTYPWGNEWDSSKANTNEKGPGKATSVGSYPAGASWVGALNLAGNVWEWVADWYGDYPADRQSNPKGPAAGQYRVLRGGSWYDGASFARAAFRLRYGPFGRFNSVGFRCASEFK